MTYLPRSGSIQPATLSKGGPIKADLCVIGAGSGGLSLAAGAAQMGASVVLIEKHRMGGDCLNSGCVPSKALIAAAHAAHPPQNGTTQKAFRAPIKWPLRHSACRGRRRSLT